MSKLYIRFSEVVERGYALRGELVDVLEDEVGVGAIGDGDRGGRAQGAVGLLVCLQNVLLGGRVAQWHGDGHGEGRLWLV